MSDHVDPWPDLDGEPVRPVETAQPLTVEEAYLAVEVADHEEDGPRHIEDYEGTWFVRGWNAALATPPQPTVEALDVDAIEKVLEMWEVDCEPTANVLHSTCDHDDQAASFVRDYLRLAHP